METIDPAISEKYGITNHGKRGMEIIRDGYAVAVFNAKPSQLENWLEAVAWCKQAYYTPADLVSGSGAFLKAAADLLANPPYSAEYCDCETPVFLNGWKICGRCSKRLAPTPPGADATRRRFQRVRGR